MTSVIELVERESEGVFAAIFTLRERETTYDDI